MNGENLKGKKVENIRNILGKEVESESYQFKLSDVFDKENIDKRKLTPEKIQEAAKKVVGRMKEIKLDREKVVFKKEETKEEKKEENASEVEPKEGEGGKNDIEKIEKEVKKVEEEIKEVGEKVENVEKKVDELAKEKKEEKEEKKEEKEKKTKESKLKRIGIILLSLIPMGILGWVKFCNWLAEKIMDSLENIAGGFK